MSVEQDKAADAAIAAIQKEHGEGSIGELGKKAIKDVPCIPTGILSVDTHVLGIGGLPRGRIIEIYGPESAGKTTVALTVVASAQALGGKAAFIDVEHALDPAWAAVNGVDVEHLLVSQPDHGEQALEIVEALVRSAAFDVVVVDSVAALVPKAELEGDMGASFMGLQARLMSQAMRKLTGIVSKSNTCLIFINQVRDKIGVMFGCFNYSARVLLADGSSEKIGKIVTQKLPVQVKSFNPTTGEVTDKAITGYFSNGKADKFLQFEVAKPCGLNGTSKFGVTDNHMIFTPSGEVPAGSLKVGDSVMSRGVFRLSDIQYQVALGSAMGDGSLRKLKSGRIRLRVGHGPKQWGYCTWKREVFGNCVNSSGVATAAENPYFEVQSCCDLVELYNHSYTPTGRQLPRLERFSLLSLAIWYMDDGTYGGTYAKWGKGKASISAKWLTEEEKLSVVGRLTELGVPKPTITKGGFLWSGAECWAMQSLIAQYIHPCMEYKVHPELRGKFKEPVWGFVEPSYKMVPAKITKIYEKPPTKSMTKFDIEVEGNHTYLVDGVGVHNSPETTTGGRALKFYSSVRLDVRRLAALKEGEVIYGNRVKIKGAKNKMASPFKETEVDLLFKSGFNKGKDMLEQGVAAGVVEQSGAWFSFKGERLGQGKDNSSIALASRIKPAELAELIKGATKKAKV